MNAFRDIFLTGLLLGGIFALVSVGLSLQYGVARVLNVAHGEFIMVGAFITFWMLGSINLNPLVSLVITGPAVFIMGLILHKTLFRRLMDTSPSLDVFEGKSMLASFGLLYVVQNLARIIWGSDVEGYNFLNSTVTAAQIPLNRLVALGFVIVLGVAFYLFLARTRLGKAIRASAQSPTTAELMGVNIHNVLAICFGLGLGLAGIAGSLLSTLFAIQTSIGLGYTVIAMVVVVLGGLGSITGAMIGGVILGLVSSTVTFFQPSLTMIAYYVIFIVLLLSRPKGIMGK
ncbi:MAG: branched-chain amino acid ABC transporter permease [Thermoleophilia bacterium]|nr:branched-chain amino acid ABC transporter permease [Thermoleophilia bacterium]